MLTHREADPAAYPFRSGRFFTVNGEWYFASREAAAHGPFVDRRRAEHACGQFVSRRAGRRRR